MTNAVIIGLIVGFLIFPALMDAVEDAFMLETNDCEELQEKLNTSSSSKLTNKFLGICIYPLLNNTSIEFLEEYGR